MMAPGTSMEGDPPPAPPTPPHPSQSGFPGRHIGVHLLIVTSLAVVAALITVRWVGRTTIYRAEARESRARMHDAVLTNTLPEGVESWNAIGANGLNIRVATVWVVEQAHRFLGARREVLYQVVDLVGIVLTLILTFVLLRRWFSPGDAVTGVLLLALFLPLTMFLHNFHPWDKPAAVSWILLILLAVHRRWAAFLGLYVVAVVVKVDAVFAAALPLFIPVPPGRVVDRIRTALIAGVAGVAVISALGALFPGGMEPRDIPLQLGRNVAAAAEMGIAYPPLLAHGLLLLLGLAGWSRADDAVRRLWLFGLGLLLPHALLTNFAEVRAQMGSVLAMLPLALHAIHPRERAAETSPAPERGGVTGGP